MSTEDVEMAAPPDEIDESDEEELIVMELSELEDLDILSSCNNYSLIVTLTPPARVLSHPPSIFDDARLCFQGLDSEHPVLKIDECETFPHCPSALSACRLTMLPSAPDTSSKEVGRTLSAATSFSAKRRTAGKEAPPPARGQPTKRFGL